MRIVLDASVAVAAARPGEEAHRAARARVARVLRGADAIVVPTLFVVEVSAALSRAGEPAPAVRAYVDALSGAAERLVGLGLRGARQARETAMRWQLRGADAVYVWLAAALSLPLCTLDGEMEQRGASVCNVIRP